MQALGSDPRLVVPVLSRWGDYLLRKAQETPATFSDDCPGAPARLVEPLQVHGELLAEAYIYARDNDGWLALVDRGLESGEILLDSVLGVSKEVAPELLERGDD